jgi:hypothetical protein
MQEVLQYLRANGYKTYIVSGGGQDFVRVYAEQVTGIPPEQVVGSMGGTKFGCDNGPTIATRPLGNSTRHSMRPRRGAGQSLI